MTDSAQPFKAPIYLPVTFYNPVLPPKRLSHSTPERERENENSRLGEFKRHLGSPKRPQNHVCPCPAHSSRGRPCLRNAAEVLSRSSPFKKNSHRPPRHPAKPSIKISFRTGQREHVNASNPTSCTHSGEQTLVDPLMGVPSELRELASCVLFFPFPPNAFVVVL